MWFIIRRGLNQFGLAHKNVNQKGSQSKWDEARHNEEMLGTNITKITISYHLIIYALIVESRLLHHHSTTT